MLQMLAAHFLYQAAFRFQIPSEFAIIALKQTFLHPSMNGGFFHENSVCGHRRYLY